MSKSGPDIIVRGKRRRTVIDEHGVQRFPANRIVRDLVDAARDGRRVDLNDIARRHQSGSYSTAEMRQLYRLMGYSISGYAELSAFEHDEILNPLWETPTPPAAAPGTSRGQPAFPSRHGVASEGEAP